MPGSPFKRTVEVDRIALQNLIAMVRTIADWDHRGYSVEEGWNESRNDADPDSRGSTYAQIIESVARDLR